MSRSSGTDYSDSFSTDKAVEESEKSLEAKLFEVEYSGDDSVSKTVRLRDWHVTAISRIRISENTNLVKVGFTAYKVGLKKLRGIIDKDDKSEIEEMVLMTSDLMFQDHNQRDDVNEDSGDFHDFEIDDPMKDVGDLSQVKRVHYQDSEYSEVTDTFCETLNFGGWIHRAIISIGLTESENIPPRLMEPAEDNVEEVTKAIDENVDRLEKIPLEHVNENMGHWLSNGISERKLTLIEAIADRMSTGYGEELVNLVSILRDNAEIIEEDRE